MGEGAVEGVRGGEGVWERGLLRESGEERGEADQSWWGHCICVEMRSATGSVRW